MSAGSETEDDGLLDALGAVAREQDEGLPALADLEALARGERAADDPVFAAAAADPGMAPLLAALADDAPERSTAHGEAALAAFAVDDGADLSVDAGHPAPAPSADNVVQFPRRRRALVAASVLAIAAAAVFLVLRPKAPTAPALPTYSVAVTGGQQIVRGADTPEIPTLGPDDRLKLILTPATPIEGPVAVTGLVQPHKGAPRPWAPPAEISPDGAVRIAGTGQALGLAPAADGVEPATLRIFVGRPEALPAALSADPILGASRGDGWHRFDVAVRLIR